MIKASTFVECFIWYIPWPTVTIRSHQRICLRPHGTLAGLCLCWYQPVCCANYQCSQGKLSTVFFFCPFFHSHFRLFSSSFTRDSFNCVPFLSSFSFHELPQTCPFDFFLFFPFLSILSHLFFHSTLLHFSFSFLCPLALFKMLLLPNTVSLKSYSSFLSPLFPLFASPCVHVPRVD